MSGRPYSFWTPLFHGLVGDSVRRVKDDAGTPALIRLTPGPLPNGSGERRETFRTLDRVRIRIGNTSVRHVPIVTVILLAVSWVYIGAAAYAVIRSGSTSGLPSGAPLLVANAGWLWYSFAMRSYAIAGPRLRGDPKAIIRAWLAEGRCPACLYDLRSLTPEPPDPNDPQEPYAQVALTRCPECSHAWRVPSGLNDTR